MSRALVVAASLAVFLPLLLAESSRAECEMGLVFDPETGVTLDMVTPFEPFDVYVLLSLDGQADAAAYSLAVSGEGADTVFLVGATYGPDGRGVVIPTPGGENVGLGECAVGYSAPIVVAHYQFVTIEWGVEFDIDLIPNPDENADLPVYSNCIGDVLPCAIGTSVINRIVGIEPDSFGRIKTLFAD